MAQELYELQEGWDWSTLAEQTITTKNIKPTSAPKQQFTYIDISSIDRYSNQIIDPKIIFGSEAPSRAKKELFENDVLFATTRPNLKNVAIFSGGVESPVASTGFCVLRAGKNIDPGFLFRFLTTEFVQQHISPFISGAQYPAITDKNLKLTPIPLPPLNEQKRIVAKINALFTRIDTAITHLQQTLELSQALFASALDGAVRPKEIPDNWIEGKLGEFASFSQGLQVPVGDQIHEFSEGLVQFLRISDFVRDDEPARYIQDPGDRYKVREQDLSMIRYGDAGKVVRGYSGAIANNLFRINAIDVFNVDFLYYLLSSPSVYGFLRAGNTSSTMPAISFKVVKNLPILIPPIEEQKKIIVYLDDLSERTRSIEVTTQEKLDDLYALKASLLDAAFKGQL